MTSFTIPLPRYQCHKQASALKISSIIQNPRGYELHFEDKRFCPIEVSYEWRFRINPQAGGYAVWYDGETSMKYATAAAFESSYTLIEGGTQPDWQQRVIAEKADLDDRLSKLRAFLGTKHDRPINDELLLIEQARVMQNLSDLLGRRIDCF